MPPALQSESRTGRGIGTGYQVIDTDVVCVLTRFHVRSLRALLRCYLRFRTVRSASRGIPGLIASLFLIENLRTCYTLSLWKNESAILEFNTKVVSHIRAANSCFADLVEGTAGPELWSAQFRLDAVSNNLRWSGVEVSENGQRS